MSASEGIELKAQHFFAELSASAVILRFGTDSGVTRVHAAREELKTAALICNFFSH